MWVSLNTSRLLLLLLPLLPSLEVPVGACVEYQHKNLKTVAYLLFLLLLPFSWGTPELHVSRHATLTTSLILRTENTYHLGVPGTRPHSSRSLLPLGEYHILSLEEAAETGPDKSSHYIVLAQDLIQNLYMSIKKKIIVWCRGLYLDRSWTEIKNGWDCWMWSHFFNRPSVAGAVLQTPLLLIN